MARDPDRAGCAIESAQRSEPMGGTASRVRRWLLIEQHGPWGRDALRESRLDAAVAARVAASAHAHGARVVLTRQIGDDRSGPRTVHLVRSDRVHRWAERLDLPDDAALADLDLSVLGSDEPPGSGAAVDSLYLVCTNGRHDPCCADFGRPVIRALRDAGVDVLESSHVGGDRFAANLVCLPSGVYFGRVPPEQAERIIADHDAGLLDLDHYRGRSAYPPLLQAAEIFARRHIGERRLESLSFESAVEVGPDATVTLVHADDRRVTVQVVRERAPAAALTCAGPGESEPWHHRLVSVEVTPGQP